MLPHFAILLASMLVAQVPAPSQGQAAGPPRVERVDDKTTIYAVPLEETFLAAARVSASAWHVVYTDKEAGIVSFTTNRSALDNRSEAATVLCVALSDGRTRVRITTQKASGHWLSIGTGDLIRRQFFLSLTARLRETGALPPDPVVKN